MRSTIIKTAIAISISVALFPQLASATSPSFSCSSNLVVSLDNGYSASCEGDFSFTDGVLQNDTSISLMAGGFLDIAVNASLIAPNISLMSENIIFNGTADIRATSLIVPNGNAQINIANVNISQTSLKEIVSGQQFQIGYGANISFGSSSNSSSAVLNSIGGSVVIKPAITGSLISNTGAIIINSGDLVLSSVPEPANYLMMILGLLPISFMRKGKVNPLLRPK